MSHSVVRGIVDAFGADRELTTIRIREHSDGGLHQLLFNHPGMTMKLGVNGGRVFSFSAVRFCFRISLLRNCFQLGGL